MIIRKYFREFALAAVFLTAAAILLNFIVPPFHSPDETKNFGAIMIYARGENQRPEVEQEIIRFMDRNQWWKYVGMGRPDELPAALSDIPFLMDYNPGSDFRVLLNNIVFYHFLLGKTAAVLGFKEVVPAYYFCRFVSLLFMAGAIFLAVLAFMKIYSRQTQFFKWGIGVVLFLPQFLLGVVAVNADAMAVFLGALFFYAVVSLMSGERKDKYFAVLIVTGVLGFLTDRSTFILIPLGVLVLFFLIKKLDYREYVVSVLAFFVVFFMLAAVLVNLFPLQADSSIRLFGTNLQNIGKALPQLFSLGEFTRELLVTSMDGFLFKFGWAAFSAAEPFYVIWRSLIVLALIGAWIYLIKWILSRFKKRQRPSADEYNFKLVVFFMMAIFLQLSAVWTYYGVHNIMTQGRYFFPLLIPVVYLFLLGINTFFDVFRKGAGRTAVAAIVVLEFFFLNFCIWQYLIPVFHLIIKSPIVGI